MVEVIARSIQPHHFLERKKGDASPVPMPGEVFGWMVTHLRLYRSVPSMELTRTRFPLFEFVDATDSLEALTDEMVATVKRRELIEGIRLLAAVADDPTRVRDAEVHAFEVAAAIARAVPSSVITRFSDSLDRLALYEERERTGETPGISLASPDLDALTYGAQSHEMVIIEGFLGVGKSSWAIEMCARAYFDRDQTPLFFSLEMEGDKLAARWDAIAAKFHYSAMKRLELDEGDKERWKKIAEKAHESRFDKDVLVIDSMRRPTDDMIFTEIERWRPDFSVVDTLDEVRAPAYLKSHWERQDHVARELKGIARSTKRPMVVVAQAGRDAEKEGATLGNIAGSITIARKADIAIGLHATPMMKKMFKLEATLLKNRDDGGEGSMFPIFRDPVNMSMRRWEQSDAVIAKPS